MSDTIKPCECPLAGWCERHQRTKTPHLHNLCQTSEKYRQHWDAEKPPKSLASKAKKLAPALTKWMQAGRPTRPQPEIDRIFALCQVCPAFQPKSADDNSEGTCSKCGCYVNKRGLLNKIKLATENCPLEKW